MAGTEGRIQSRANKRADSPRVSVVRDDRILPEVHWLAGLVVIVLLTAAIILYLFPDKTAELFAWHIQSIMSALLMGAGYGAGAYFFARVFLGPRWHWFDIYFPAIALFTLILGVSTIIYWDKFNHGTISFYAWVLLYFTTPFILPIVWLRNRRTDPGTPDPGDVIVPKPVRLAAGIAGVGLLSLAALMLLLPDVVISIWPWELTPLTCRSIGGWLSAPGLSDLLFAFEPRWSAWRIIVQHQLLAVSLILLAAVRAWGEFDAGRPGTWLFVGGMICFWLAMAVLLYVMDIRRTRSAHMEVVWRGLTYYCDTH